MAEKIWLAGIVLVLTCAVTTEAPAQYVRVYAAADSVQAHDRVFRGYLETKLQALGFVVLEPVEETDSFTGWELTF